MNYLSRDKGFTQIRFLGHNFSRRLEKLPGMTSRINVKQGLLFWIPGMQKLENSFSPRNDRWNSRKQGFTLIELLVVIAIISLLSSVVLASVNVAREKARLSAAFKADANIHHALGDAVVGQWEFDECSGATVGDGSGLGHAGTFGSAATWSVDTPKGDGCSLRLNGTANGYVDLGNSTDFDLTDPITISAWIKTTTLTNQIIIGKDHRTSYYINFANNVISFWTAGNGPGRPAILSDDRWHNVIVTYGSGVKKMYIDGRQIYSASASAPLVDTANLRIGDSGYGHAYFNGNIDSIKLYSKNLTAGEVKSLYAKEGKKILLAQK